MGKQRRRKHERREKAPTPAKARWKTKRLGAAIISAFFALLPLWLNIRPRITVAVEPALDSGDPFTARFIITNDGSLLPVQNASISCYFHVVDYARTGRVESFSTIWNEGIGTLEAEDQTTGTCWPAISTNDRRADDKLLSADISIFVDYRVRFWPGRLTKQARFVTVRDAAGSLLWTPRTVN